MAYLCLLVMLLIIMKNNHYDRKSKVEIGIYGIVSTFSSDGFPITEAKQLIRLNKF